MNTAAPTFDRHRMRRLRAALLALASLGIVWQVRASWEVLSRLGVAPPAASLPFGLSGASGEIEWVHQAEQARLAPGDVVLAVDGSPLTGAAVLARAVAIRAPGDVLALRIRGASGSAERVVELPLPARQPGTLAVRVMEVVLLLVMPWLCLALGTWVGWLRPADRRAWLLFVLMLAFPHMTSGWLSVGGWEDWLRAPALAYRAVMRAVLGVAMLLFGIGFPERTPWDVRVPWLKWALNVPSLVLGLLLAAQTVAYFESFALHAALLPAASLARWPFEALFFAQIGGFFAALGPKTAVLDSPDARRRVTLVMRGSMIALALPGLVAARALLTGRGFTEAVPFWLMPLVLLPLLSFPLTLAYVIVVHRAMDVRVALRQGVQYALAKRGARAVLVLVVAGSSALATAVLLNPQAGVAAKAASVALGLGAMLAVGFLAEPLARWVDRRFFREALDAERLLLDVSEKIRHLLDAKPVIETVTRAVAQSMHVPHVSVILRSNGHYAPVHSVGFGEPPRVEFASEAPTLRRLRATARPERVHVEDPASWLHRDPEMTDAERGRLDALGAQLLVPLATSNDLLGFLALGEKRSEQPYSGSDLRVLETLAAQTTLALENARLAATVARDAAQRERMTRELNLAREVQQRLFPPDPELPWLDCGGYCRPALGVGGDYYDFIPLDDGRFAIAFADISGKGFGAALLMANLQASVRGQLLVASDDLAAMVARVNRLVYDASDSNRYATFFCCVLDPEARRLTYVNAGHNPPMLLRGDGSVERLESGGTVVGLLEDFPWMQDEVALEPGEQLVIYTDGISEAMNPADEEWGEERLARLLPELRGREARELIAGILEPVDAFVAGAKQHDDMTLVVAGLRR